MILAFQAFGASIRQVSAHFLVSVVANLIAMILSLPLVLLIGLVAIVGRSVTLIPLGIVLLLGVLPNPAAAGMQTVARELAQGEIVVLRVQSDALREYWKPALRMWLLSLGGTLVILLNIGFYAHLGQTRASLQPIAASLDLAWLLVLLFWLSVHLYLYPLLLEQKVKRTLLLYRNASLMAMGRPFFALTVTLLWIAVLSLGAATGLATLIGLTVGAVIQQNAFARILPKFELT